VNYFIKQDLFEEDFLQIPKSLLLNTKYKNLSADAKVIWSILYEMQIFFYRAGWVDHDTGRVYCYHPQRFIAELDMCESFLIIDYLKELHQFKLLEAEKSEVPKLWKYYLIKPDSNNLKMYWKINEKQEELSQKLNHYVTTYIERTKEETEDVMTPEVIRKYNGDLLKEFIKKHQLEHDELVSELYNECIMKNPKNKLSMEYISEAYQNIVNAGNIVEGARKTRQTEEDKFLNQRRQALFYMKNTQKVFAFSNSNFNDDTLLLFYKHFDLAIELHNRNLLSLPLLSSLKIKYRLSSETFNVLLDQAFTLYDNQAEELIQFHVFFEKILENQSIFEREARLKDEISTKLLGLPEHLRDFVYHELKKNLEHFPTRYELVVNNLRVINTVYQEFDGTVSDTIFEKAFRRLFMQEEIYSVNAYFKNAIKWISEEGNKPKKEDKTPIVDVEEKIPEKPVDKEEWLSKVVNIRDTEGSVDKMSAKEKEEYFKRAEELKKQLEELDF